MGNMLVKAGKSVYEGIVIGKIHVWHKEKEEIIKEYATDKEAEVNRFAEVKHAVLLRLQMLHEKALKEVGEEEALILEVHQMLLEDPDYTESVHRFITEEGWKAEASVYMTGERFAELFAAMEDAYMRAREADIRDITNQLLDQLRGIIPSESRIEEPVILVAEDLAPSETVGFEKNRLLGIVTKKGSANSHTAILARSMCLPALVNVDIEIGKSLQGATGVIDGLEGIFYVNPDSQTLKRLQAKKRSLEKDAMALEAMKGKETVSISGQKVMLYANIGNEKEAEYALEQDAEGVGLFRSELLYLGRKEAPGEEEQFEIYKNVLMKMQGKRVIIRTLDIGADKQAPYLDMAQEENPAMGVRAVRLCLLKPELFKVQLRALLRAAVYGRLAIMIPFISSVSEILQVKDIIKNVQKALQEEQVEYGEAELGMMIETPAAAVISDLLAPHVDFFSIGTNDLSQYTMAADRQNAILEPLLNPHNEAILRLIKMTVEHAHEQGIWCGICGEMAADLTLTQAFLDMKIDELSVAPAFILKLREKICACE